MPKKNRFGGGKRNFAQANCREQQMVQRQTYLGKNSPGALKSLICTLLGICLPRDAWKELPPDELARIATDIEYEGKNR